MAKQTLTFVVLPNGPAAAGKLRLSIYVTPRLQDAELLSSFPDLLNWTAQIKNHGLQFTLTSGVNTATVAVTKSVLRPDIWSAIFKPDTFVEKYQNPDYSKRVFISYPARDAMAFTKFAYQTISANVLQTYKRDVSKLGQVLNQLIFRDGLGSNLDAELSDVRLATWRGQQGEDQVLPASGGLGDATGQPLVDVRSSPDGIPTARTTPAQTRRMASQVALFHRMPSAEGRPPLPSTAKDFSKLLDFHKALTALNSYPAIMRALGLVIDLEVPASLCADSPTAGTYAAIAITAVTPGFKWKIDPQLCLPQTAYLRSATEFAAAPATDPGSLATGAYLPADVIDGYLSLSPDYFHLTQIDLDGALLNALSLADNLALVQFRNNAGASNPVQVEDVLPALRSAGLSLMADYRALQLLQAIRENQAFDDALQSNSALPRPFNARDLVRGYRIDIHSARTGLWYSLHRRDSTFKFGPANDPVLHIADEEGFTQLAAAQPADDPTRPVDQASVDAEAPQPGTDIYLHERVARWNGWSLSAKRPGGALNRSADPAKALDHDPTINEAKTPFKMATTFTATAKSLPKLRFGDSYQLRARAVDLAGNSIPLAHPTVPGAAAPSGMSFPYLRFEPVPHPVVILREATKQGAALERLVIRSYNNHAALDSTATTEVDQRHIIPPRIAERLAEHHGMFDNAQGKLKGDAATYNEIITRDAAELPETDGVPMENQAQAIMPYLPDPLARGAAFRDLPGGPTNTNGTVVKNQLDYQVTASVVPRAGSVTYVSFGTGWPDRVPFRLVIVEGRKAPHWDATNRVLTVSLRKSMSVEVPLSSYMAPDDLSLMGVWDWVRQYFEYTELQSIQNNGPVFPSDNLALLTQYTLEGGHPMITPERTLTLVHAVQQPLGQPAFTILPIVHLSGQSGALANAFSPLTAWRSPDSHDAVLLGALKIHGASTAKVDIQASWREFVDDPSQPAPVQKPASAHVETIELQDPLTDGVIYSDAAQTRAVANYISLGDTLWFSGTFDTIPGMAAPSEIAAPLHRFDDTKHRRVQYQAIAASRFQEYFPEPALTFTRSSAKVVANVPSSARPVAPDVLYVVPVFGYQKQETTNLRTSVRQGNGLRVYLKRPWYSSGESELLGVVLWPSAQNSPDTPTREKYKAHFTQWGLDPIWNSHNLDAVPAIYDLPGKVASGNSLSLEETDLAVDVAGHCVFFDEVRKLWYCDITFSNDETYNPFVRLALARYQPHSLPGVELSHVVLADFAQLTPDRSAVISINPANPRTARIFVGGVAPEGPQLPKFVVAVEQRMTNVTSDLGWEPAPALAVTVLEDAPESGNVDEVLWSGTVTFSKAPPKDKYRVVIREYEVLEVDPIVIKVVGVFKQFADRLVYAAIIPYDFPSR